MQDEFEDFMDLLARECDGQWFYGKVAGVTWPNPDGSSRQEIAATLVERDELSLMAEPENAFDANAIAVHSPDGDQVGYLEGRLARELTHRMKQGVRARCFVRGTRSRCGTTGVSFGLLQWTEA